MKLVAEAMNRVVATIDLGLTLGEAADVLRRTGAEHLLVLDEANLVGILRGCDLRGERPEGPVSGRMRPPLPRVRPDLRIEEAAATLEACEAGCLPVAVGGLVLGTLSASELEQAGIGAARDCRNHEHRRWARRSLG